MPRRATAAAKHHVFISHSSRDRARAQAVCAALESDGIPCWIAPRDVVAGAGYAELIVQAVAASRAVIVLFSRAANRSDAVLNELEIAAHRGIPVMPIRLEDREPEGAAEFYLRRRHWFDAHDDFEGRLRLLAAAVRALLAPTTAAARPTVAAPPHLHNLPARGTTFVGRDEDVQRAAERLRDAPLLTIVGTGGVGKTRLASAIAEGCAATGAEVWFFDLAPLTADTLVPTMLSVLGAHGDDAPSALVAALCDRRALLVLDNCERVLAAAGAVAEAIAGGCAAVQVLATSRTPLGLAAESVYRLGTLDVPTAARLFGDRAAVANPQFAVTVENATRIESICARLDGLPLAVELAAARVRVLSLEELERRLDDRFRILTGGARTALPHQQTMRALIDWSHDLLAEPERVLFRRLAVFTGGCSLDAVERVCAGGTLEHEYPLDLLTSLVDKSLLVANVDDGAARYHLLESLREYAWERLRDAGEAAQLQRGHAAYFAGEAARDYAAWDSGRVTPRSAIDVELDNFRSALSWSFGGAEGANGAALAADMVPGLMRRSLLNEAVTWCVRALEASAPLPAAVEARLHYGLSMLYNNQLSLSAAMAAAERACALYRGTGETRNLTRALSQAAQQYARAGRSDEALACAEEALLGARRLGDPALTAVTLRRHAMVCGALDLERMREEFAESVELFRGLERRDEAARSLAWWGESEYRAGHVERALRVSLDALALESGPARMYLANNVATYALLLKDFARAHEAAAETLALGRAARHPTVTALAMSYLAALSAAAEPLRAAQLLGYARARLAALRYRLDDTDDAITQRVLDALAEAPACGAPADVLRTGALWTDEQAFDAAAVFAQVSTAK